ncbi:hypothetical protein [Acanthopleuribacter pedis]|uniref:Uncharacterized protein n=1 Tax=Acanthopleuribacter pedis TaxID=442870 RepID=A0A8J7QBN8_9BACT|nr:hypothetical protein [Acanthopleuribacter pedis]MBO1322636.1 hypothetical protein [Acanthopleuribacter pedis]
MFDLLILLAMTAVKKVDCPQRDLAIILDGTPEEWADAPWTRLEKGTLFLATHRDQHYFYVALRGTDADVARNIHARGLTVWVNPEGKKDKTLGLYLPGRGGPRGARHGSLEEAALSESGRSRDEMRGEDYGAFEVLGGDGAFREWIDPATSFGLAFEVVFTDEGFTAEVRFPLTSAKGRPFAVNAVKKKIALGLFTQEPRGGQRGGRGGGERMGRDGMGRGGGMGRGSGMGRGGGMGREGMGPPPRRRPGGGHRAKIDLWLKVHFRN